MTAGAIKEIPDRYPTVSVFVENDFKSWHSSLQFFIAVMLDCSVIYLPNDPQTWREFYRGLEPKFREWKAQRWFYDYRIFCDQNANTLEEAKLNIAESVQRGEFKCRIFLKPMVGIKWIMINAAITRLNANFDESLAATVSAA